MSQPPSLGGLRVLLVGPYPPPYGGVASLMVSLLSGLGEHGADEMVTLHFGDSDAVEIVNEGLVYRRRVAAHLWQLFLLWNWKTCWYVYRSLWGQGLGGRRLLSEAVKAVIINQISRRHRCNVVSFYQSDLSLALLPLQREWRGGRGIVLTLFGELYDSPDFFRARADLMSRVLLAAGALAASSAHCARSFEILNVGRQIEVIYVGVDMERFSENASLRATYREQLGIRADDVVCLFMGRFNREMGLDRLIEIIPEVLRKDDRIRFVLAGAKGPLVEAAQRCREQFPHRVTVMNDVPFAVQPSMYAAADLVLTPSRDQHACMGVTIKEAMAAARVVIGTDSGGIPEAIVHDETGWIVPLKPDGNVDNEAYEQAILLLANDASRRDEMGRIARRRAEELFREEITVERTARMFMSCLPHA